MISDLRFLVSVIACC